LIISPLTHLALNKIPHQRVPAVPPFQQSIHAEAANSRYRETTNRRSSQPQLYKHTILTPSNRLGLALAAPWPPLPTCGPTKNPAPATAHPPNPPPSAKCPYAAGCGPSGLHSINCTNYDRDYQGHNCQIEDLCGPETQKRQGGFRVEEFPDRQTEEPVDCGFECE
jgi:hypothetical protein